MKKLILAAVLAAALQTGSFAQTPGSQIAGKEVARNDDVVFHQLDDHTWVGTGHLMANESVYLVEGNDKAALIDAGTKMADLDKIVASLTKKPVMLLITHVHRDHAGSAINYFPELWLNAGDTPLIPRTMGNYKGRINHLTDGQVIDLGGRKLEVVFTPAHTAGSTTFIDKAAGYGFSGDAFGSGNLLLFGDFSTLIATCQKTSALMEKYGIKKLYPGHFFGKNEETKQRVDDEITLSKDVLSGKVKGEPIPNSRFGLSTIVTAYGVHINYNESALK